MRRKGDALEQRWRRLILKICAGVSGTVTGSILFLAELLLWAYWYRDNGTIFTFNSFVNVALFLVVMVVLCVLPIAAGVFVYYQAYQYMHSNPNQIIIAIGYPLAVVIGSIIVLVSIIAASSVLLTMVAVMLLYFAIVAVALPASFRDVNCSLGK